MMYDNFFLEEAALELDSLQEAGGLVSWLKRAYTGMDNGLLEELRYELQRKIKSESQRQGVLQDIDKFIREGQGLTASQFAYHFVVTGPAFIGPITSFILRNSNTKDGSRKRYIEALEKIRDEVEKMKVS